MPLYEYQCESCGSVFEKIQKFADAPLTVHEECGGHVHRLLTAPAFHLKGSGWYVTDYGKGGAKDPKHDGNGGSASTAEAKSDSSAKTDSSAKSDSSSKSESSSKSDHSSSKTDSAPSKPTPATTAKSDK